MTKAEYIRRKRRRQKIKRNVVSFLLGCVIAIPFCIGHVHSVKQWEQTKKEWALEQIQQDNEIERERQKALEEDDLLRIGRSGETSGESFFVDPDIPYEVQAAAHEAGERYGIQPEFLEAVAWVESRYEPDAVSSDGECIGLMQIAPKWHVDRIASLGYTTEDLWEVTPSMMVGADYLLELFYTHDDPHWVLMKYNGDSDAAGYLAGDAEISDYATAVMNKFHELDEAHREGGGGL